MPQENRKRKQTTKDETVTGAACPTRGRKRSNSEVWEDPDDEMVVARGWSAYCAYLSLIDNRSRLSYTS